MNRLKNIEAVIVKEPIKVMEGDYLKIVDNRTSKQYEISVKQSKDCYFVNSKDWAKITDDNKEKLSVYDPGYMDTICSTSRISYIDGDKGILEYRGIPIEQLAEKSSFLEVAFLLIHGELPVKSQLDTFSDKYIL
jgi:citrate synthase